MKVVHINTVLGIGSTGSIIENLANSSTEIESLVIYGRGNSENVQNSYCISSTIKHYLNALYTRITGNEINYSKRKTLKAIMKIKEFSPDIIHIHNIHGYYIDYELLFNFLCDYKKPVIWTFHDCYPFTGHCTHPSVHNCYKYLKGCSDCKYKNLYPKSLFFNKAHKNYKIKENFYSSVENMHIVTPSKWLANCVKDTFLKKYPISVINNGIDENIFYPVESDIKYKMGLSDKFIIFCASYSWGELKGFNTLIELSKILPSSFHIVIIGVNENQKKELPENITGILKTNNKKEMSSLYSMADVFLNPTKCDNFPTVNIESLACGTPVITSNVGGSAESIDDSCGIVVFSNTADEFKKAVLEIREHPKNKEDCIKKAHSFYKTEINKKYLELYKSYN